jgi:hypothetical protein
MPSFADISREPPKQPEIGTSEDWEQIEEALGYEGVVPERRDRVCRQLGTISDVYFGPRRAIARSSRSKR